MGLQIGTRGRWLGEEGWAGGGGEGAVPPCVPAASPPSGRPPEAAWARPRRRRRAHGPLPRCWLVPSAQAGGRARVPAAREAGARLGGTRGRPGSQPGSAVTCGGPASVPGVHSAPRDAVASDAARD